MAQLIINIPDNQVPRIQAAFGSTLGLEEDATVLVIPVAAEEIKAYIVSDQAALPDPDFTS